VLARIRALAEAAVPDAARRARDRQRDDAERRRRRAMRRELEAVARRLWNSAGAQGTDSGIS
jgi:hypothetical protein